MFEIWMDAQKGFPFTERSWEQAYMRCKYFQNVALRKIGPEYAETLRDHCYEGELNKARSFELYNLK